MLSGERMVFTVRIRVISLLLALVLTVSLISVPVSAAGDRASEIEQQIRTTYRAALRGSGRYSFNGYCGSMVNWQTCILGIDQYVHGCDGKDEYDHYVSQGVTCGGYKVRAYPAGQYTLKSALNAITNNGTMDAYNILVGFQRTNTREGSIYGHALLVHAILNGTVYFAECFNVSLNGKFWQEGDPIHCSIDEFCAFYDRWTVFDGVAYFGVKSYADVCSEYPAGMTAMATRDLTVYEEPWDPEVYEADPTGGKIQKGRMVAVTALLKTPGGRYWYRLSNGGYVEAEHLVRIADDGNDITISDLRVPGALRRGVGWALRGRINATGSELRSVEVIVYDPVVGIEEPVFRGFLEEPGQSIDLSIKAMDRQMVFRKLDTGIYRIAICVEANTYSLQEGQVVQHSQTVTLHDSQFRIITDWHRYARVTYDGNGGDSTLDAKTIPAGDALGALPSAIRRGYTFAGWALDPEGNHMVTEQTVIEGDTVLYAQWEQGGRLNGWHAYDGLWRYYENSKAVEGWIQTGSVTFWQENGKPVKGWQTVGGLERYFNSAGALLTGWQSIGGREYYLNADGCRTVGWYYEDGGSYYFNEKGVRQTGWVFDGGNGYYLYSHGAVATGDCVIEGAQCKFDDNGLLEIAQQLTEGGSYYVVYDRQATDTALVTLENLLLG